MPPVLCHFDRLDEHLRFQVLDYLTPFEKRQVKCVSPQLRQDLRYHNSMGFVRAASLMNYMGSGSQSLNLDYRLQRAQSLKEKVREIPGGMTAILQASRDGDVFLEGPSAVALLARYYQDCEVVGLIALLQQIPESESFLQGIRHLSARMKINQIQSWIIDHAGQVNSLTELQIVNYKKTQVGTLHQLQVEGVGNKIFNFLPRAIGCFTRLRMLSLQNNLLNSLPMEMGRLPLRGLNLHRNHFKAIPEVFSLLQGVEELDLSNNDIEDLTETSPLWRMRSLEKLDLSYNRITKLPDQFSRLRSLKTLDLRGNPFQKEQLERLIPQFTQERLKIWVDHPIQLSEFAEQFRLQGRYVLRIETQGDRVCCDLDKRGSQSPVTQRMETEELYDE
jgi:hypothetical protein